MRLGIYLYTRDPASITASNIEASLRLIDFSSTLRVSRTVGPANWFAQNKQLIAGAARVSSPPRDIDQKPFDDIAGIAELARQQSVLTVSYAYTKSQRLSALSQALHTEVPAGAEGFFLSSSSFSFGPSDIVAFTEDADGQDDVELLDVAQLTFALSCDNYVGARFDLFQQAVPSVSAFSTLRQDLEHVVGPLKLHFSY